MQTNTHVCTRKHVHTKKLTAYACESFTKCYWRKNSSKTRNKSGGNVFCFVFNSQLGLDTSVTNIHCRIQVRLLKNRHFLEGSDQQKGESGGGSRTLALGIKWLGVTLVMSPFPFWWPPSWILKMLGNSERTIVGAAHSQQRRLFSWMTVIALE